MGAWGAGAFENDDALGLVEEELTLESIEAALRAALRRGYLDVDDGSRGIAAAELVCALNGHPPKHLPPTAREQLPALASPGVKLVTLAKRAVVRVRQRKTSELASLRENDAGWAAAMDELSSRLARRVKKRKPQARRPRPRRPRELEFLYTASPTGEYQAYVVELGEEVMTGVGVTGAMGPAVSLNREDARADEVHLEWTGRKALTVRFPAHAAVAQAPFVWEVPRTVKLHDGTGIRVTLSRVAAESS